jgi:tetratricopeptide (TPR) repeat protein
MPRIARLYHRFLDDGCTADFIRSVASVYTLSSLHRVMEDGGRMARRAAVLAVTLIGQAESVPKVGRCLRDPDRAVRLIAEDGLQAMWQRADTFDQCQRLQMVMRFNVSGEHRAAVELADSILERSPDFGEAWFQRSEALLAQSQFLAAIAGCRQALECESLHFPAALGMAQGYLEIGELTAAIDSLHGALQIHPHLEFARAQLLRLERELRGQTDR